MKVHLSCIQSNGDNDGVSSEEEHSEEAVKEVKKPRLGGSSETKEAKNDNEMLEEGNMADDKTNNFGELAEEKLGENKGFEETLGAIAALINQHEEVPLGDPGPGCARHGVLDLAGGSDNHREVIHEDHEPPDDEGPGVAKLPGGGDQHEEVPLGDTVSSGDLDSGGDEGQGSPEPSQHEGVPLEDPGPHISNEDGGEGLAGATQ